MSSLPKRSGSNCSFSKGDDQISVRRIQKESKEVEGRKSGVESIRSERTSTDGNDIAVNDSCVLRHFSKYKSSHLRFLAWVAYTRKYANESMTIEESRTCPLLWCRTEFPDQEAMLKHVWNCPHLSKGLYWCYHCQKHEKLGKFHKRCQGGTPSKTDKIATVAKRIFSKLGAGHHRRCSGAQHTGEDFAVHETWKSSDEKTMEAQSYGDPPDWDYPMIQELPDTSIPYEMAGDWTAACQELADTSIVEMMGTECPTEAGNSLEDFPNNFYAETFEDFNIRPTAPKTKVTSPRLPRLDTSMNSLNDTSRWMNPESFSHLVSPASSSIGTYSSSIVSPLSAVGTFDPNYNTDISPTDTEASGQSFFSDSGYTSATSVWDASTGSFSRVPSINEPKGTKRTWDCAAIAEEHHITIPDLVAPVVFPVSIPDFGQGLTESLNSTPSVSRSSSNASDKSRARDFSPHWEDAASLVRSFEEVLDQHVEHTKSVLRHMPSNAMTSQFLNISKSSLVSTGVKTLGEVLAGRQPMGAVEVFAFQHLACAAAIVMYHDSDRIHSQEWFQDSLSWALGIEPENQPLYNQIARSIWSPAYTSDSTQPTCPPSRTNKLFLSSQHFLDILEALHAQQKASQEMQTQIPNNAFNFMQMSFEFKAKSTVIDKLITMNTIEAFIADVVDVDKKLGQGRISTVRGLELELIAAGKLSSRSDTAYHRFLSHVTRLCDELYTEESTNEKSRSEHQIQSLSLLQKYLPGHEHDGSLRPSEDFDIRIEDHDEEGDMMFSFDFDAAAAKDGDVSSFLEGGSANGSGRLDVDFSSTNTSFNTPNHQLTAPTSTPMQLSSSSHAHTPKVTPQSTTTSIPPVSSLPKNSSSTRSPPETNKHVCSLCNYRPTGEEKWKASNLRRHKRTQHPNIGQGGRRLYRCRFPGCKSVFTRSDNLRSHEREKGHEGWVVGGMGRERELRKEDGDGQGDGTEGERRVRRRVDDGDEVAGS